FRPTLNGVWETISDDYVLINTITDEIIPWEGSIPTYVETSVEDPPILSASIKLIEPSGEGFLDAEETAMIQVTLTNSGKGSAKMTRISLFQQEGPTLYYNVSNTINEILPNQSITSEFKLSIPENIENESVKFKVSFIEEQGFEPAPLTFTAETREMSKPELQFIDFGVEDANGDGKISKGETADITLRLQNIGYGKANQVVLNILENRLNNVFIISDKYFELEDLESGESKDIIFTISTNNRVSDIVDIYFSITEKRPQFSIEDSIILEIEKTQKQLEPIVFSGKDIEKKIEYSKNLSIDIEQNIPKSKTSNKNTLAIIFGIENYRNISNVNFAYRDATIMREYFSKTIGIPEEQIYFRANDEVTLGEFRKIFSKNGWLDKRVIENETDIYFYYAGHGAPAIKEEKAFLIPFDGDPNYPVQTGYSLETVFENLSKLNANSVTVFLDACFTGANRENEMLLADARPVSIQLKNNYVNNVTVFSATSSYEISSSYPKNKHGLFSYFLMKGMQGEADTNKDNKLTINELFDYTKKNVSRIAGTLDREQTPQLECLEPEKIIINY
ncbi:MAG: caspase family protein, partial [Candidatus Tenebribacter burtonii]|nr:caspase family protein [Candidatus Tenebribacter burtonii]